MGKPNIKSSNPFAKPTTQKWSTRDKQKGKFKKVFSSLEKQKHAVKIKMQNKQMLKVQQAEKARQEREQAQKEKEARINAYKKKRSEKAKAISRKTHRGQPLMKDRMQLLLKQIEEMKRTK